MTAERPAILFVCVHDAGRSQMVTSPDDAAGRDLDAGRIGDEIDRRVRALVAELAP